jgi:hypothetical protein
MDSRSFRDHNSRVARPIELRSKKGCKKTSRETIHTLNVKNRFTTNRVKRDTKLPKKGSRVKKRALHSRALELKSLELKKGLSILELSSWNLSSWKKGSPFKGQKGLSILELWPRKLLELIKLKKIIFCFKKIQKI